MQNWGTELYSGGVEGAYHHCWLSSVCNLSSFFDNAMICCSSCHAENPCNLLENFTTYMCLVKYLIYKVKAQTPFVLWDGERLALLI